MTAVASPISSTSPVLDDGADRAPFLDDRRLAGIGALTFAGLVISTNIALGGSPAHDASAAEVTQFLTDHRTMNVLSTAAFALGAPFLVAFGTGFYSRLRKAGRAVDATWARMGMSGALLILPTFAAVVSSRLALIVGGDEIIGSPELVSLLWRLEMSAFLVNSLPLGIGLLGFGIAGSRAGLLPKFFRWLAPVGAACGVLSAATAVSTLEGAPTLAFGFIAFACWMLLLITGGIRQLRSAD
jgi:hypothetical protein